MNRKQRKTLAAIFDDPVPNTIPWKSIENLLVGLGATIREGDRSRVTIIFEHSRISAHRPHPGKEAKPYQVRAVRQLLIEMDIRP